MLVFSKSLQLNVFFSFLLLKILQANFLAQTEALMWGKTRGETREDLLNAKMTGDQLNALIPHKARTSIRV